jgi:hypothetical protein
MEKRSEVPKLEDPGRLESQSEDGSMTEGRESPISSSGSFQSSFVKRFTSPILTRANTFNQRPAPRQNVDETQLEKLKSFFVDWWLFEMLCCIISTGCFAAIIAVLASWNNQTLPSHWPMNINLTTLIAILAAFAKYSLVMPLQVCLGQLKWTWFQTGHSRQLLDLEKFDQATRGPFGAARLIVHTKGR